MIYGFGRLFMTGNNAAAGRISRFRSYIMHAWAIQTLTLNLEAANDSLIIADRY